MIRQDKQLTMLQMIENSRLDRMLEFSKVGPKFKNGLTVAILSNDHNIHFYKDIELIGKFTLPTKCPKRKEDLAWQYRSKDLQQYENDLIVWFSQPAKTFKGKTLGISNFERLIDTWDSMHN